MNNETKCFGLFGHNIVKQEPEEGEIICDEEESKLKVKNIDLDSHESLANNFFAEIDAQKERKNRKYCFCCNVNISKYTCPRCGVKTCSMKCSIQHKNELDCSGIRDQLSFVPLKNYSEQDFYSDCSFLEKGNEYINNAERVLKNNPKKDLSNWTIRFMQECQKRNIHYRKMPLVFQRSRSNRSILLYKEKSIHWDIEFDFPYCKLKNEKFHEEERNETIYKSIQFKRNRISENIKLIEIIQQIIDTKKWIDELEEPEINFEKIDFSPYKNFDWIILLKHDSGKYFKPLVKEWTIRKNLENQEIVEYPAVVIILKKFVDHFKILDDNKKL